MNEPMTLMAEVDCALIAAEMPSQRLIEVTLTAPSDGAGHPRAPLNVALILDRSGSMDGEKLEYVKEAACYLVEMLDGRDRLALISYDDMVRRVASGKPVTIERRAELQRRVRSIFTGGSTNLGEGWLRGASEVADHLLPQGINRALLLTDGLANVGITEPTALAGHAQELNARGVSTSTFGVGADFNEFLLEAMATQGGGHFFFIEHPRQIPRLFREELGELLTTTAREACLRAQVPQGVGLELLGELPHELHGDLLSVPLGDLSAGRDRRFCFQALTPAGAPGAQGRITFTVSYVDLDGRPQAVQAAAVFTYAGRAAVAAAPQNEAVKKRAAQVRIATAQTQALDLERQGRLGEAQQHLQRAGAIYASQLDADELADLEVLTATVAEGLDPMTRKQRHMASYKRRNSR